MKTGQGSNYKRSIDQRIHKRFKLQSGVFAVTGISSVLRGKAMDISDSGLSFRYIYRNEAEGLDETSELLIYISGNGYYLKKLPFKIISNLSVPRVGPFESISMRRCGLQFLQLTSDHKKQLEHLIHNYTICELAVMPSHSRLQPKCVIENLVES